MLGAGGPGGIIGGRPGPPPRGEMYVGGAPETGGPGLSRSWFRVSVAGGAGWKGLVMEGPAAGAPAERRGQRCTEQSQGVCRVGHRRDQHPGFRGHTHHLAERGWRPWLLAAWGPAGSPASPGRRGLHWALGMTPASSAWAVWGSGQLRVEGSPQPQPESPRLHSCRTPQDCGQAPLQQAALAPLEGAQGAHHRDGWRESRKGGPWYQVAEPRAKSRSA